MLKMKQENLKLGFYPYTYVRTSVMKSMLFRKDDYHKMLKMGFNEIAKFLQESNYKSEINLLAAEYSGADLLELALVKSAAESLKKLIRISPEELALLIKEYAKRKDIEDLKTILRGKFTGSDEKSVIRSMTGAGTLSYDFLISLLKKESVEEILKSNRLVDFFMFEEGIKYMKEKNSLAAIENALDRFYYNHLIRFSKNLPKDGSLFRSFIVKEVEILNIMTLFRLKRAKFKNEEIKSFLTYSGNRLRDAKISALSGIDSVEDVAKSLEKTEYRQVVAEGIDEFKKNGSLIKLETGLYKHLLKHSALMLHQHPLSVDVILGYMLAKDIEIRNLKIIIKGKQLGLGEEFIESQLVY